MTDCDCIIKLLKARVTKTVSVRKVHRFIDGRMFAADRNESKRFVYRRTDTELETVSVRKVHRFIDGRMLLADRNESKRFVYRRTDTELE